MKGKILLGVALGFCLWAAALPVPLWAQWTGEIGGGYVWQDVTGSEDTFVTQYGQHQGWVLEDFALAYAPKGQDVFSVKAYGFGGAEPAQYGAILFRPNSDWKFGLTYNNQTYFYGLARGDEANRRSKWSLERWKGFAVWDGWSAARLTLGLRYYKKDGYVYRGIFGQNNVFTTRNNYDSDMKEASIKIETKTLPVYLSFEQTYAQYEQKDRWQAVGGEGYAVYPPSLSYLSVANTPRKSTTDVPTSRLIAAYRNDWVDLAGSLFYSKADMDSTGTRLTIYDVMSTPHGQFQWLDSTAGNAKLDNRNANIDAAFRLGYGWSVRVAGDYRDSTQDSNLVGAHILTLGDPGGFMKSYYTGIDERGFFDVKDTMGKIEVEKQGDGWAVFAGYNGGTRDVSWKRENGDEGEDVSRTGNGYFLGGSWSRSPKLRVNFQYEHGTFSNYVFRTDPEVVEAMNLTLSSQVGNGWTLAARAHTENGENSSAVSYDHHRAQNFGFTAGWAAKDGNGGFNLNADYTNLSTRTNIVYPSGDPGASIYMLDMWTVSANVYFKVGPVKIDADLGGLRNGSGNTDPVRTVAAGLRATIDGPQHTQFVVFGQYRSYVEDWATRNNYYATRYGVIIRWRF